MKLQSTNNWHRRDFRFTAVCEAPGCGHIEENLSGYDDSNFYDNVIPDIKCSKCQQSTNSMGIQPESISTKYHPNTTL